MTRITLLAATVLAAPALLPGTAAAQPVTGLYIGGAGGGNFLQREFFKSYSGRTYSTVGGRTTSGTYGGPLSGASASFDPGAAGLASVGYGFGNGLRVELEGDYRYNPIQAPGFRVAREEKYGGMLNALFDLDVGSPYVFPYIGAGAGYSWVTNAYRTGTAARSARSGAWTAASPTRPLPGCPCPFPPSWACRSRRSTVSSR